jgi:TM2 domain-containing membrane protein YozV
MTLLLTLVFVIGYVFIALEHSFKIDKAASALLVGTPVRI